MSERLDFDDVLNTCLDRLRQGDTLEACLSSFPSYAERLAPLLSMAALLRTPDSPLMSSEALATGEARLLAHADQLRARQRQAAPARRRVAAGFLTGTRRLVAAAVASLVLLCGVLSAGTVSASSASLPGSPLYSVKRATEALVSSVAPTPHLQTQVHLAWADRRLREVEAVMARDSAVDDSLLAALEQETEQALTAAKLAGPESLTATVAHTEHQQAVLSRLLDEAPQAARPGLERALAASAKRHANARSALEGDSPPVTPPGQVKGKEPPGKEGKEGEAGPMVDTPTASTDTSETQDELNPPGRGRGRGVGADQDTGVGQGRGQGQGQDRTGTPSHNQGRGYGPDKKDELHPLGKDKEPGNSPIPGEAPGQGQSGEKPDKANNPGNGKDKDK